LQILQKLKNRLLFYEKGTALLVDKNTVQITKDDISKTVSADFILIATGSRPRVPSNIDVDENIIVTSDGIRNFKSFPESIVVMGAGVIGCEFATIFSSFGKTRVNLIDKADRILPFEDADIAAVIKNNLEIHGAHVHHGSSLTRMAVVAGRVEYELEYKNGEKAIHTVDKALISIGRVPNIENLGL
jgi:dihydrolipoamide dehydrogenase